MELEDQQRRLRADLAGLGIHTTDLQRAKLLERQNTLQRRIDAWQAVQQLFMPCVVSLRAQSASLDNSLQSQNTPLFLPSTVCSHHAISTTLLNHEWCLREGQAHDALADLRGHLEVRAYLFNYKDTYIRGQQENTRSKAIVDAVQAKIRMVAERYRNTYNCMGLLAAALGKTDWQGFLRKLDDTHIRHISADDGSGSVGSRQISWIWSSGSTAFVERTELLNVSANQNLQESLRVKWCKSRARALRWTEECDLLQQEMSNVVAYHEWAAREWDMRVDQTFLGLDNYLEGANVYARRQAWLHRGMKDHCVHTWRYVKDWVRFGQAEEARGRLSVVEIMAESSVRPSTLESMPEAAEDWE